MIECRSIQEFRAWRAKQQKVGFVPTMGALHAGHLSLLPLVQRPKHSVCVSIFVNPLQFGPSEDLTRYPRPLDEDLKLLADAGVSCVFLPNAGDITQHLTVSVNSGQFGKILEGSFRPGHFDGVATIVAKLFNIVQPQVAAFGLKDLQQCAVINSLVRDLNFPISLEFGPTLRDADGLAMSSRNAYLSPTARAIAPKIHQVLSDLRDELVTGLIDRHELLGKAKLSLVDAGFEVDYLELVDHKTMLPSFDLSSAYLVVAAKLEGVRLIDNLAIS